MKRGPLGAPLIYVYAALCGILGSFSALAFQGLVDLIQEHVFGAADSLLAAAHLLEPWKRPLVPAAGAIAAAIVVRFFVRRSTAFGVTDLMESVSMRQNQVRFGPTLGRCLSSMCVIATGGSVGREGPIVQLGAAFASKVAKWTRVGPRRQAVLLGCGVAAGMAAAYNAPLAGALFVMEIVLANFAIDVFAPVLLSSVVSTLVLHKVRGGDMAIYQIPVDLQVGGATPVLFALLLGIPAGFCSVGFQRLLENMPRAFAPVASRPVLLAAIGGLLVGLIGVEFPEVWGNGYEATSSILSGEFPWHLVLALFFLKPLATALSVSSGSSGGVFTPTLFVGAALGTLFGQGLSAVFPEAGIEPAAFAVMGMAALIAGTTQAPIMAMVMLFEMTHSRDMLLPLMLATLASSVTARWIGGDSIYTRKLRARGVPIEGGIEQVTLQQTRVRDLMRTCPHRVVRPETPLDDVLEVFQNSRADVLYVVEEHGELEGYVDLHDIKSFLNQDDLGPIVIAKDVQRRAMVIEANQRIAQVIEAFDEPLIQELPVVDEDGRFAGRFTRRDLIACLNLEVLKRQNLRAKFVLDEGTSHYVELPRGTALAKVQVPASLVGRTLGESELRDLHEVNLITLSKTDADGREQRMVPDPDLVLEAGHELIVMGSEEAIARLRATD